MQAEPEDRSDELLREAYAALGEGDAERCLRLLAPLNRNDPACEAVRATARGVLAMNASDPAAADREFAAAKATRVPLAWVLRERARYLASAGRFRAAMRCLALVNESLPGAMFQLWRQLPDADLVRASPWAIQGFLRLAPPRIYQMQPVKEAMVRRLGVECAAMVLANQLRPGTPWRLVELPLVSLMEYARDGACYFKEILPPREVTIRSPAVFRRKRAPGLLGTTRSVFICKLAGAVVTGKSNLIRVRDRILMDFQGDEFVRVPVNLDADPLVLTNGPGCVSTLVFENAAAAALPEALSLVGIHTWNYGHWIFEFMFQVWAAMREPGFERLPIVVDAQMPHQLLECLTFFVGDRHPIHVLAPGTSVEVGVLWTLSKIAYWPGGDRPGTEIYAEGELSDMAPLAGLLRTLEPQLETIPAVPTDARRLYLSRKDSQKRSIVNRNEVEAWFASQGFEVTDFDSIPFAEQVRKIRAAEVIAGPDGAAFYGMLFARPGTRVGLLSQPIVEGYEWWSGMFEELGLHLLVYSSQLARLNPDYRSQSDIQVDVGDLPAFLRGLLEQQPGSRDADPAPRRIAEPVPAAPNPSRGAASAIVVADSRTFGLQKAYDLFVRGDVQAALEAALGQAHGGLLAAALIHACRAQLAASSGNVEQALHQADAAYEIGVPLPALLHSIAQRLGSSEAGIDKVYECHAALDQLGADGMSQFFQTRGYARTVQFAPAAFRQLLCGAAPLPHRLRGMKRTLAAAFGTAGAAMVHAEALRFRGGWRLRRLGVKSLKEFAREKALAWREIIPSRHVTMTAPPVFGRQTSEVIEGRTRSVFRACLPDVLVVGKSNVMVADDQVVMDFEPEEIQRVPVDFDVQPFIHDGGPQGLLVTLPATATAELAEAFALTGLFTSNFGHWVFEFMQQVWLALDADLDGVPVLIDRQMPAQHREMLEFFCQGRHPIVVVEPGDSVMVRRLWTCSRVAYWPGGERPPDGPVPEFELADTEAIARQLLRLQPLLDTVESAGYPERLYLTRGAQQSRALVNREEVEEQFRRTGFAIANFGELPFLEQLRYLRAARVVVLEAGSTMYGLLLARPGLVIGELTGAEPSAHEWCAEMFRSLGHRGLVLFPCESFSGSQVANSHKNRANLDDLQVFLENLLQLAGQRHPKVVPPRHDDV